MGILCITASYMKVMCVVMLGAACIIIIITIMSAGDGGI